MENTQTTPQKWYNKKWLIILLCIVFFPVGLYGLWKSNIFSKGWQIGITAFIALCIIFNFANKSENKNDKTEQASVVPELTQAQKDSIETENKKQQLDQTIRAENLYALYEENEIKADENFKGKKFYVQGTVVSIANDILNNPYVTLNAGHQILSVQCSFEDKNELVNLNKGEQITIYGECKGKTINVLMGDCILAKNYSLAK